MTYDKSVASGVEKSLEVSVFQELFLTKVSDKLALICCWVQLFLEELFNWKSFHVVGKK